MRAQILFPCKTKKPTVTLLTQDPGPKLCHPYVPTKPGNFQDVARMQVCAIPRGPSDCSSAVTTWVHFLSIHVSQCVHVTTRPFVFLFPELKEL